MNGEDLPTKMHGRWRELLDVQGELVAAYLFAIQHCSPKTRADIRSYLAYQTGQIEALGRLLPEGRGWRS